MSELVPAPSRLPWERLDGETPKAYHAFALYRDLLHRASLTNVARMLYEERTGKPWPPKPTKAALAAAHAIRTQIGRWSVRWRWVERLEAYLDDVDRRVRDERETELLRAERNEGQIARQLEAIVAARVFGRAAAVRQDGTPVEPVDAINPADLSPLDAGKLYEVAVRGRRLADGQPTDILRGAHAISQADLLRVYSGLYEIALTFIAEDRQARYASEVQQFVETGRLPWQAR